MPVKGLVPGLLEIGKIKAGIKGKKIVSAKGNEFRPPQKLDHFLITKNERDGNGDYLTDQTLTSVLMNTESCANKNGDIVSIPIRLLYNDIDLNFPTRYASYVNGKLSCSGNGENARTLDGRDVPCLCNRLDGAYPGKDKCKINGSLSCIIDGANSLGGCYKFRTTSRNTCQNIIGAMSFYQAATGGLLAFLPFNLTIQPKSTTIPSTGATTTIYVVSIVYAGTMDELRGAALKIAKANNEYLGFMQMIEHNAKQEAFGSDDTEDITEEFYPDAVSVNGNGEDGGNSGNGGSKVDPEPEESKGDDFDELEKTLENKMGKVAETPEVSPDVEINPETAPKREEQKVESAPAKEEPAGGTEKQAIPFGGLDKAQFQDAYRMLKQTNNMHIWTENLKKTGFAKANLINNAKTARRFLQSVTGDVPF